MSLSKAGALLVGFAALCLAIASAQQRSEIEYNRASIQAKRTTIISEALDFTDKEAKGFWPLYNEYRAALGRNEDFQTNLLMELEESSYELEDDQALRLLDQAMKFDRTRLKVIQKYMNQFKKILPGKKVARFFHLEAKMDAIVDYEFATKIPLVE